MPAKAPKAAQPQAQPHYTFRAGFHSSISADVVGQRIEYLRAMLHRPPTWQDVLADARSPLSPIHGHFEWRDNEAAERYRIIQAKGLVAAVRITVVRHQESVIMPAFVSQVDGQGQSRRIVLLRVQEATAPDRRKRTLADIIRRYYTTTGRDRGLGFPELEPLFELLDDLYEQHCQ